ncbi:MAG: hypothetical protein J0M05_05365, partial [Candidatus Kapabacteria bacterium]|nr:hypothetical protein [Candidatus Kapabacteria bacterium]
MKTLFLFFSFIIVGTLQAQYTDPPSITRLHGVYARWQNVKNNYWYADTVQANFSDTSVYCFDHKIFALGSQWGVPTRSLAKRIHHRFFNEKWKYAPFDTAMIHIPRNSGRHYFSSNNMTLLSYNFSVAHRWSPGIAPPSGTVNGSDWNFSPPADDTNGLVYGFWHREGGTVMPNYSYKLMADSAIGYGNNGRLVLSQPVNNLWKNGGIPFYSGTDVSTHKDVIARNGRHWYFSITLNRSDAFYNDSTAADDTVLTIKIPVRFDYVLKRPPLPDTIIKRSQSLQFDSILQVGTQTANIQYHSRGGFMDTRLVYGADSILTIRRSMLPKFSDTSLITLSGYFLCSLPYPVDSVPGHPNPSFSFPNEKGKIDSLNVEIYYHGKCNITIRDCMIGTQMSRWVFRGERDTIIAGLMTAHDIRPFFSLRDSCPDLRFWRFYGLDETTYPHWLYHRYLSKLFERNFTTEGPSHYTYRHIVPQKDYWHGALPILTQLAKPYLGRFFDGTINVNSYNVHGYRGGIYEPIHNTYYKHNYDKRSGGYHVNAIGAASNTYSMLDVLEHCAIEFSHNKKLFYSGSPILWNVHVMQEWRVSKDTAPHPDRPSLRLSNRPPLTAEDYRSAVWMPIMYGAKGLMYDRFNAGRMSIHPSNTTDANYYDPSKNNMDCGLSGFHVNVPKSWIRSENSAHGDSSIYADGMGSDFLYTNHPTWMDGYIDFAATSGYHLIKPSRFYIGLRTLRHEIRKMHDYLHKIGDTLIKLRLHAAYHKGTFITAHAENGDSTTINKYISTQPSRLKTQSFLRTTSDTWDSVNVGITILRHKDIPVENEFYITVFNSCNSPLLALPASRRPSFAYPFRDSLTFYSGYEFDSLTTDFTNTLSAGDKAFWQQQRYKQGGARMITLPFNVKASDNHYALLRVTELGADDTYLDSVYNYRTNPALYQKIDTVIGQDRSVMVKLLPGEGKIFRVRVQYPDRFTGDLSHSNQTKLVAHSIMRHDSVQNKWVEGDSVVYHAVYHKKIAGASARTGVYYRVSKPIAMASNTNALQWHNEILLSDSVEHHNRINLNDNCAYPALVVRFDSTMNTYNSFIVYGCTSSYSGDGTPFTGQHIVESIVALRRDTIINTSHGFSLDTVHSNVLSDYGTPMINASDSVNFYVYSCAQRGIIAGWKKPRVIDRFLVNTVNFRFTHPLNCYDPVFDARHPSLNPYSRYLRGQKENDCIVVWQEKNTCVPRENIFTTRLRVQNDTIVYGLSPNFDIPTPYSVLFKHDSTIFCSSTMTQSFDTVLSHHFPVVYRELWHADDSSAYCHFQTYYPGHTTTDFHLDRVVWEVHQGGSAVNFLSDRGHWFYDTTIAGTMQPNRFGVGWLGHLWMGAYSYPMPISPPASLDQPSISAGTAAYFKDYPPVNWYGCVNSYTQRAMNLTFRHQAGGVTSIFSLPQTHAYPPIREFVQMIDHNNVTQSHVAARGSVLLNDWWRNHRIYNKTVDNGIVLDPYQIRSSGQHYYRFG